MKKKTKSLNLLKLILTVILPLVVWMGIIFYFSSRQKVAVTSDLVFGFLIFKSLHLIEYIVLYCLWLRFFHYLNCKMKYLWAFVLTVLYAFTDEFHQLFVPTREGLFRDVVIDSIGGFVAFVGVNLSKKIQKLLFV